MRHRIAGFLLATGIACAQTPLKFEVASIRPSNSADRRLFLDVQPGGRFIARNFSVKRLIEWAYDIKDFQISGGPGWMGSDLYDISANAENSGNPDKSNLRLQSLLAERFQLVIRREAQDVPVYALVVAKNGPKFKDAKESDPNIVDLSKRPDLAGRGGRPRFTMIRRGRLTAQGGDMRLLVSELSNFLGRTVVDKTGLTGTYDLKLEWQPDENQVAMFQALGVPEGFGAPAPDPLGPSLFAALEEQLGLRLDSQRGSVEMFVIERIERPSEN